MDKDVDPRVEAAFGAGRPVTACTMPLASAVALFFRAGLGVPSVIFISHGMR